MRLIEKVWFYEHKAKYLLVPLLLPLTLLFWLISSCRRLAFAVNIKKSIKLDVPVIVVGNIGIGGNGKTPVVLHLIEQCLSLGLKPGVVSRGYGSNAPHYPYLLDDESNAVESGDEPLLIYQRTKVPVVIGADRIANGQVLIEKGCNIIIADDGLQHYRLQRDLELVVVDAKRLFGNGFLLPAGPLREGTWRLNKNVITILNGNLTPQKLSREQGKLFENALNMQLAAKEVINLNSQEHIELGDFLQQNPSINALAGIGDPIRFFNTLTQCGFKVEERQGFVDHHKFTLVDLKVFNTDMPLLMTEKDAVKCIDFSTKNCWYLPVTANFSAKDTNCLLTEISRLACKN